MLDEGLFIRLIELVRTKRDEDRLLWSVVLDLMYEMSRMQRLRPQDFCEILLLVAIAPRLATIDLQVLTGVCCSGD